MPEPKFSAIIDDELEVGDSEAANLICKTDEARVQAAYWQGRCETMEKAIAEIKQSHEREIAATREGYEMTLGYLKDRLNRFEVEKDPPH